MSDLLKISPSIISKNKQAPTDSGLRPPLNHMSHPEETNIHVQQQSQHQQSIKDDAHNHNILPVAPAKLPGWGPKTSFRQAVAAVNAAIPPEGLKTPAGEGGKLTFGSLGGPSLPPRTQSAPPQLEDDETVAATTTAAHETQTASNSTGQMETINESNVITLPTSPNQTTKPINISFGAASEETTPEQSGDYHHAEQLQYQQGHQQYQQSSIGHPSYNNYNQQFGHQNYNVSNGQRYNNHPYSNEPRPYYNSNRQKPHYHHQAQNQSFLNTQGDSYQHQNYSSHSHYPHATGEGSHRSYGNFPNSVDQQSYQPVGGYYPYYRPPPDYHAFNAPHPTMAPPFYQPTESVATSSSASPFPPAVPRVAPRPVSKISIVDPNTGQNIDLHSAALPKISKPATLESADKSASATSVSAQPEKKTVAVEIVDPNSNKVIDLHSIVHRKEEADTATSVAEAISNDITNEKFEKSVDSLATFDDDEDVFADAAKLPGQGEDSLDQSMEEDEDSESCTSSEEDESIPSGPQLLRRGQSIIYPDSTIGALFTPPVKLEDPWRYKIAFLLLFRKVCTGKAADVNVVLPAPSSSASGHRQSTSSSNRRHSRQDRERSDYGSERRSSGSRRAGRESKDYQQHPLLRSEPAVLSNRSENAWNAANETILPEEQVKLRELKGLLNKLTLEKFDPISDAILALDIIHPTLMPSVIEVLFSKSVDEPAFASMYARLCHKIVSKEAADKRKVLKEIPRAQDEPTPKVDSDFRRFIVTKCQLEYERKEAWSKQRLEKANATETTPESEGKTKSNTGELTEEDYAMIKLKSRVLGNMRFIGELFKVGLITEKIMHRVTQSLLVNYEVPEEEEIESLCKLLSTVGVILDKPQAANIWASYVTRLQALTVNMQLSTRVRFMVMDVLDLRKEGWRVANRDLIPKTFDELAREEQEREAARAASLASANVSGSDRRASRGSISGPPGRSSPSVRYSTAPTSTDRERGDARISDARLDPRFKTQHQSQQRRPLEHHQSTVSSSSPFETTKSRNQPPSGRGGSRASVNRSNDDLSNRSGSPALSNTSFGSRGASGPVANPSNRFYALEHGDEHHTQHHHQGSRNPYRLAPLPPSILRRGQPIAIDEVANVESIENSLSSMTIQSESQQLAQEVVQESFLPSTLDPIKVKRTCSIFDEYIVQKNLEDVIDEFASVPAPLRSGLLAGLLTHALDKSRKAVEAVEAVLSRLKEKSFIDAQVAIEALAEIFAQLDDIAVDLPSIFELGGVLVGYFSKLGLASLEDLLARLEAVKERDATSVAKLFYFAVASGSKPISWLFEGEATAALQSSSFAGKVKVAGLYERMPELEALQFEDELKQVLVASKGLDYSSLLNNIRSVLLPHQKNKNPAILKIVSKFIFASIHDSFPWQNGRLEEEYLPALLTILTVFEEYQQQLVRKVSSSKAIRLVGTNPALLGILDSLTLEYQTTDIVYFERVFTGLWKFGVVPAWVYRVWMEDTAYDKRAALFKVAKWVNENLDDQEEDEDEDGEEGENESDHVEETL